MSTAIPYLWQCRRKESLAGLSLSPGLSVLPGTSRCGIQRMLCLGICSCSQRNQGHNCCSACPGDFLPVGLCWAGLWDWAAIGAALIVLGCPAVLLVTQGATGTL